MRLSLKLKAIKAVKSTTNDRSELRLEEIQIKHGFLNFASFSFLKYFKELQLVVLGEFCKKC